MNTKFRKSGERGILSILTAILLLDSFSAFGQEFIKSPSVKTATSIVREVSEHEWLVYSYDGGSEGWFTLVNDMSSTAPRMSLPLSHYVSDFEIYNDTVYYCGWVDSIRSIALFGYFELSSSLATPVYCCRFPELKRLSKLVVFNNENKPHVVFTGLMDLSLFTLGDAIENAPNIWYFNLTTNTTGDSLSYDDVAVIKNYIVATSRIIDRDSGIIHYFNKPSSYTTMFPLFIYRPIAYPTTTPILITSCLDNNFATLCKSSASSFVMSRYKPFNDDGSFQSTYYGECRDINFNSTDDYVEVLVYDQIEKYKGGLAIHYDHTLPSTVSLPVHIYQNPYNNGCDLCSIDYLEYNPKCFIASGTNYNGYGMLELYKYKYDEWHLCPLRTMIRVEKIDNEISALVKDCTPILLYKELQPIECGVEEIAVEPLCEY